VAIFIIYGQKSKGIVAVFSSIDAGSADQGASSLPNRSDRYSDGVQQARLPSAVYLFLAFSSFFGDCLAVILRFLPITPITWFLVVLSASQ